MDDGSSERGGTGRDRRRCRGEGRAGMEDACAPPRISRAPETSLRMSEVHCGGVSLSGVALVVVVAAVVVVDPSTIVVGVSVQPRGPVPVLERRRPQFDRARVRLSVTASGVGVPSESSALPALAEELPRRRHGCCTTVASAALGNLGNPHRTANADLVKCGPTTPSEVHLLVRY